jgi:hypothetical protein
MAPVAPAISPAVSPPASVTGEDSSTPQPGFGWEFTHVLEARVCEKEHEMHARFQRYERFGMQWEEARLQTPEHLRKAYDELVDAIANDRSPSPSPKAPAMPTAVRNSQRVDTTIKNKPVWSEDISKRKKGSHHILSRGMRTQLTIYLSADPLHRHNENKITTQKQRKTMRVCRSRSRNHNSGERLGDQKQISIHKMITRSRNITL